MLFNMKILSILLLLLSVSTARAVDFQKVYDLPGMTAAQIEKAFGPAVIDVGVSNLEMMSGAFDAMGGKGGSSTINLASNYKIRCDIGGGGWLPAVNAWVKGDVILEAKDGRARVTVAGLKVNTMKDDSALSRTSCLKTIETTVDARMSSLKALGGNW